MRCFGGHGKPVYFKRSPDLEVVHVCLGGR